MSAWAIGRLGTEAAKATSELLALLKDEYWKVRSNACISLASAGPSAAPAALPILMKVLKDGSINRSTVAETIVRLGPSGEKSIIDMLNKEPLSNLVLRTSVVRALGQANVGTNNIDYVVETLYKLSSDQNPAVRKEALLSMKSLAERAKCKLTYLKPKTLLPLYLKYLKDQVKEIRDICVQCIVAVGPQGELTLIEALTKDSSHVVRAQAAKGLGLIGPASFRTLVLGLHDSHPYVRKAVASTIYKHFSSKCLAEEFLGKTTQRQTLRCAVREVLSLPYPLPLGCGNVLKEFLSMIENEMDKDSCNDY
jgi:HEAT repeat protein